MKMFGAFARRKSAGKQEHSVSQLLSWQYKLSFFLKIKTNNFFLFTQIHDHALETRQNMRDLVPWTLREYFESKIKQNKKKCLFQLQVI